MSTQAKTFSHAVGWSLTLSIVGSFTVAIGAGHSAEMPPYILHIDAVSGNDSSADGSKLKPFKTITRALAVARPRALLQLAPGEYSEASGEQFPLVLNAVDLVGDEASRGEAIKIVGSGKNMSPTFANQNVAVVIGKEVVMRGVTITNPVNRGYGVWVESVSPVIRNNTFVGSQHDGLFITGTSAAKVTGNYFLNNKSDGLTAADLSTPTIENNVFERTGFGMNVTGRAKPKIIGNTIRNNVDGIIIEGRSSPVLRRNTIQNNQRSGVVVLGLASADLGTEAEAGGNTFAGHSKADINNVTNPPSPLVALGNQWTSPILAGQVSAEPEIVALAAENAARIAEIAEIEAASAFRVLVSDTSAARMKGIKGLTPQVMPQGFQGKTVLQVASFRDQISADRLVGQLVKKGFKARTVSASALKTPPKAPPAVLPVKPPTAAPVSSAGKSPAVTPAPVVVKLPATATEGKAVQPAKPTVASIFTPASSTPLPVKSSTVAPKIAVASSFRVLVTDSKLDDVTRLKELVERVIQQTHDGKPVLQVGVFSSQENASRLVQMLTEKGFRAILVSAELPG